MVSTEHRRHRYGVDGACGCGKTRDAVQAERGRKNRNRGNNVERELARELGLERIGHYGEAEDLIGFDIYNRRWVSSVKSRKTGSFPGWLADELARINGEHYERFVAVVEAPGPGRKARRLAITYLDDFARLVGLGGSKE